VIWTGRKEGRPLKCFSIVLFLRDNARSQAVRIRKFVTNFGCTMLPRCVVTSHYQIITCLVLKIAAKSLVRQWRGAAEQRASVAAEEGAQVCGTGRRVAYRRWKTTGDKDGDCFEKVPVPTAMLQWSSLKCSLVQLGNITKYEMGSITFCLSLVVTPNND
jgi:hypothetical protein